MQLNVYADTVVQTCEGLKLLKDMILQTPYLWAVPWTVDNNQRGVTFHRSYKEAHNYISKYKLCKGAPHPTDNPRFVSVSNWLYDYVNNYGSFWTDLKYLSDAETYCPTIH